MLTASGLTKGFGSRVLFSDVAIQLSPGRRIALVGGNGTGKTTLIETLIGIQEPDAGSVHLPKDHRLGYLPQDLDVQTTGSVLEEVLAGAEHITALGREVEELGALLADTGRDDYEAILNRYGDAQSRFEQLGGYAIESEAHRILDGLGFDPRDHDRPVRDLSGGWRMRVALGKLLLSQPDVLVLDEPTNHLDVDSVAWLEQQLESWPGGLLFVSHDRDFIDGVANRVIELAGSRATEYVGTFADFVIAREEILERQRAAAAAQARKVAHAEQFIERFRYKATKARQVQSRIKALAKIEEVEVEERKVSRARFSFPEPPRSSRVVVELQEVTVGYDDDPEPVLTDVSFTIERGQKVALVGPNGAGKTTLVKLLTGELRPTVGTATIGNNVEMVAFDQHQADVMVGSRMVVDEFRTVPGVNQGTHNPRTYLGAFGFTGDAAERRVDDLSGGEQTRLALAKVMANPANLLLLDEPTNHLDLPSCDTLEDALATYPGTVLLITHDRHLIRAVADAMVIVRNGTATWRDGVDEAALAPASGGSPAPTTTSAPEREAAAPPAPKRKPKQSEAQRAAKKAKQRELERVEKRWEEAEEHVADLQRQLADPAVYEDQTKVDELVAEHDAAKETAASLMAEWERLSASLDR